MGVGSLSLLQQIFLDPGIEPGFPALQVNSLPAELLEKPRQTLICSMWDLVPWPGIEPRPSALRAWSLSPWTTREVPICPLLWLPWHVPDHCSSWKLYRYDRSLKLHWAYPLTLWSVWIHNILATSCSFILMSMRLLIQQINAVFCKIEGQFRSLGPIIGQGPEEWIYFWGKTVKVYY